VVTTLPDAAPEEAEQALEKEAADDHLQLRGPKAHEQNNEISLKLR
jgi:hypothetical protein